MRSGTSRGAREGHGHGAISPFFRHFYLEEIDKQWVEHLTDMEHLRDGIGLRGYGQRDPKQEYKKEGYDIFISMMATISSTVCSNLFKVRVQRERSEVERMERADAERRAAQQRAMQARHGSEPLAADEEAANATARAARPQPRVSVQPIRRDSPKIGRNDPCPCGSGLKFKNAMGLRSTTATAATTTLRRREREGECSARANGGSTSSGEGGTSPPPSSVPEAASPLAFEPLPLLACAA